MKIKVICKELNFEKVYSVEIKEVIKKKDYWLSFGKKFSSDLNMMKDEVLEMASEDGLPTLRGQLVEFECDGYDKCGLKITN